MVLYLMNVSKKPFTETAKKNAHFHPYISNLIAAYQQTSYGHNVSPQKMGVKKQENPGF